MKKPKALFMIYLIIALSFSIILIMPNVKAQDKGCCELTKDGEYCLYTDEQNCATRIAKGVTCKYTDYCLEGCCYSDDTGYCYPNTPKSRCENLQGTWSSDSTCSIPQCKKGCCMISDQCLFITPTMCKRETSKYGVTMKFDDSIQTESECFDQCRSQEFGACVSYDKSCSFTTREACTETKQEGTHIGFHAGKLCSHPELGTNCAKQQKTNCYQGKVYWFDSCGNRENIYMSNKELSYNKGYFLTSPKCTAGKDDKDCGNCDYSKGTTCGSALDIKPTYGDYICRDINCKETTLSKASLDATGGSKKHGESWCLYEASVGYGKDIVGSRHLKASCINGEEIIEPCKDYREEICIQTVSEGKSVTELGSLFNLGEGYSEALCVKNRYEGCNSCNAMIGQDRIDCCLDAKTKDCFLTQDGLCIPHVPPGLKFWEEESVKDICEQGRSVCEVKYSKKAIGLTGGKKWKCIKGCECLNPSWFKAAAKKCAAQGDCGAYYNIEGEFTSEGLSTSGYAPVTEDLVENWENLIKPPPEDNKLIKSKTGLWVTGALAAWFLGQTIYTALATFTIPTGIITFTGGVKVTGETVITTFFGELATGGAFGGGALGVIAAIAFWAVAAYIFIEILDLALPAKTKTKTIAVSCMPWEQPDKTTDCEECDTGLAPCSEYRCRSLGEFCEIINEGTENEKCTYIDPHDASSPVIRSAQQDYRYRETDLGYEITEEIPPYTPITLAISTDEFAKCRFSFEQGIPYKQMETEGAPFGEIRWSKNHTLPLEISSELSEAYFELTNNREYNLYVKCIDKAKNDNEKDYNIRFKIKPGPDTMPPKIEITIPENNAYVPAHLDKIDLNIYLNEPSKCKWSNSDTDYTSMINTFECVESSLDISSYLYGTYECKTELPIEQQTTNNYFFRCQDRSDNLNVNTQSYPYTLVSTIPLKITSVEPAGMVYTANPVLKVKTSEGADDGIAFCGFSTKNDEIYNMIPFLETNSTEHTQQLGPLISGVYKYYVGCMDKAGNIDKDSITFEVEADLTPPEVARIYKDVQQNVLVIELTEKSTCEYDFEAFNYGSGIAMTGTNDFIHKASLDPENNIYFVICQDEYENQIDFKVIT